MEELKPCPCCRGEAYVSSNVDAFTKPRKSFWYRIRCTKCHLTTTSFAYLDEAIAAWNKREGVPVEGFHALIGWEE